MTDTLPNITGINDNNKYVNLENGKIATLSEMYDSDGNIITFRPAIVEIAPDAPNHSIKVGQNNIIRLRLKTEYIRLHAPNHREYNLQFDDLGGHYYVNIDDVIKVYMTFSNIKRYNSGNIRSITVKIFTAGGINETIL